MKIDECGISGREDGRKVGSRRRRGELSPSVTGSLFDCGSEFESAVQWTNRKLTIGLDLSVVLLSTKCTHPKIK